VLELVGQVLAYSGIGIAILLLGFYVVDVLTPGHLGRHIAAGNPNACLLAASALTSLGLVLWFTIFFTGEGWDGLDEVLVFGLVAIAVQAIGFLLLDLLVPGDLRHSAMGGTHDAAGDKVALAEGRSAFHPAAGVAAAIHVAVALVVCASLT